MSFPKSDISFVSCGQPVVCRRRLESLFSLSLLVILRSMTAQFDEVGRSQSLL